MYQNVNARAERLFLLIKSIVFVAFALPLPLPSSLLKLPHRELKHTTAQNNGINEPKQ